MDEYNFKTKLKATLCAPFFVILLVQAYKQIAVHIMHRSFASLRSTLLTVHCALFSLGTVFYLKT
jgi:hypothetical protein